jgi:hypothetical protein
MILGLIGEAIFAQTNEVSSINIVGYVRKPVPPGIALGSPVFYKLNGTQTLNEILGTNGVASDDPAFADNVYLYIAGFGYSNFFLYNGGGTEYDFKWVDGTIVSTNIINPGQAFWVRNRAATATNTYVLMGQIVDTATNYISIKPGLQLLSYPYSCDVAVTNLHLTNGIASDDPAFADNMYIYIPGFGYTNLFLYNGGGTEYDFKWVDGVQVSTNIIKMGDGFWYRSRALTNGIWTEPRPYLND